MDLQYIMLTAGVTGAVAAIFMPVVAVWRYMQDSQREHSRMWWILRAVAVELVIIAAIVNVAFLYFRPSGVTFLPLLSIICLVLAAIIFELG